VTTEVRIYVEGGGDTADGKARVRRGFHEFMHELVGIARQKRIRWNVIACGGRTQAFDSFISAERDHAEAFNVLLVDSEGPLQAASPREHLKTRDGWALALAKDCQIHLMVEAVEAWVMAAPEGLKSYYGQGFNENPISSRRNLEEEPKDGLEPSLKAATKGTKKGEYHKIRHCPDLLERTDPSKVRSRCPHCRDLFNALCDELGAPHLP
jgi:hypothetical protein